MAMQRSTQSEALGASVDWSLVAEIDVEKESISPILVDTITVQVTIRERESKLDKNTPAKVLAIRVHMCAHTNHSQ